MFSISGMATLSFGKFTLSLVDNTANGCCSCTAAHLRSVYTVHPVFICPLRNRPAAEEEESSSINSDPEAKVRNFNLGLDSV